MDDGTRFPEVSEALREKLRSEYDRMLGFAEMVRLNPGCGFDRQTLKAWTVVQGWKREWVPPERLTEGGAKPDRAVVVPLVTRPSKEPAAAPAAALTSVTGRGVSASSITVEVVEAACAEPAVSLRQIARRIGCDETTLKKARDADPAVREACERGIERTIAQVEDVYLRQALAGDATAGRFILERKGGYKAAVDMNVSGKDGGPVEVAVVHALAQRMIEKVKAREAAGKAGRGPAGEDVVEAEVEEGPTAPKGEA
jgi:hypothetical protein